MKQLRLRVSQVVGLALGILLFDVVRRRLRSDTWDYGHTTSDAGTLNAGQGDVRRFSR